MPPFTAGLIVSASLVPRPSPRPAGGRTPRASVLLASSGRPGHRPGGERLTADTPKTTTAGNAFIAPAGWSVVVRGAATILEAPEGGSRIALDRRAGAPTPKPRWRRPGPPISRRHAGRSRSPTTCPTRTAGRRRADVLPDVAERAPRRRRARRSTPTGSGRWSSTTWRRTSARSAARRSASIFDRAAAEGLHARDVCRQEGARARRGAHRRARRSSSRRRARRRACPASRSASCRTARSCSRAASACASSASPRKSTPTRLYMIASNTKALTTLLLAKLVDRRKITWDTPVTQLLPQFKLGDADDHAPGARQAPDLRLHRPAAPGLRVAVRVQGRHAGAARSPRSARCSRPASSARCSSTRTRSPAPPASSAGTCCIRSSSSAPPTTRRCRTQVFDAARHDVDDVRLSRARWPATTPPRTRPTSTASRRVAAMAIELLDHPGAAGRRRVEQRQRHAQVRADGAGAGRAAGRQPLHRARRRCSRGARRRSRSARTRPTAWG